MILRGVAVAVALVVLLSGVAVVLVSYRSADTLIHPARQLVATTPANLSLPYAVVDFQSTDSIALDGWWIPADSPKGTVVVLHGYGESKNQSLAYAPFLHNASYNVFTFDFRAHGESGGDHTTVGRDETADVEGAWLYLAQRGDVDMAHVAFMGFSMGAATAINAAVDLPHARAIVSDSSFATLQNIASHSITHFTGLPKYPFGPMAVYFASRMVHEDIATNQPVVAIKQIHMPVLVIQGGQDDIAYPDADGRALYDAAPPGSEWLLIPAAHHVKGHDVDRAEYEARVIAFLEKNVAS